MTWNLSEGLELVKCGIPEISVLDSLVCSGRFNWRELRSLNERVEHVSDQFSGDAKLQWSVKYRTAFLAQQQGDFRKESQILQQLLSILDKHPQQFSSFKQELTLALCISMLRCLEVEKAIELTGTLSLPLQTHMMALACKYDTSYESVFLDLFSSSEMLRYRTEP